MPLIHYNAKKSFLALIAFELWSNMCTWNLTFLNRGSTKTGIRILNRYFEGMCVEIMMGPISDAKAYVRLRSDNFE